MISRLPRRLRRAVRQLGQLTRRRRPAIVYHPRYDVALPAVPNDPLRAERILAFLAAEGLALRRCVLSPRPASLKSLERVHDAEYLERVHEPETIASAFATDIRADQVDRILDHQRLYVGGTRLAVRVALAGRAPAINLGGGLHHAHPDQGQGFCLFNDVAVAIAAARARGFAGKVLVVDLDLHDGDGTRAAFAADETVHTFSIHARHWGPTEAVESTSIELGDAVEDDVYLAALRDALPPVFARFAPALAIYLAGTDPAHDDRLGDWRLSAAGMLARDRFVVSEVAAQARRGGRPLPLAVLLAGGYGPETWRYSARFLSALLHGGEPIEPPSTEEMTLRRYRWISSLLDPGELSGGNADNPFGLSREDLFLPAWGVMKETRFLGFYTKHGLELTLERAGLLERLRDLGFEHPTLDLALDDPAGHTVRVYASPAREALLIELRAQADRRTVPSLELLRLEWLLMQNPRAGFDAAPPLPGQRHPGLGMSHDIVALLLAACDRLHLDGVLWVPSHFHTAAPWRDRLVAVEPREGARLRAFERAFEGVSLDVASRAIADGQVIDAATGAPAPWKPAPLVIPRSPAAERWAEAQRRAIADQPVPDYRWRQGDAAA